MTEKRASDAMTVAVTDFLAGRPNRPRARYLSRYPISTLKRS